MATKACVAHLDHKGVQILIGRSKANGPLRMAFRLPAGTKKGQPVGLRLDDGWQAGLVVGGCKDRYCEAPVASKMTDTAISAFSRNASGLIAYEFKDRILLIPFPLDGFREAIAAVKK